jgi:hypothetical protein
MSGRHHGITRALSSLERQRSNFASRTIRSRRDMHHKKTEQLLLNSKPLSKVEMEDICDWPTDMTISIQPDGDSARRIRRRRRSSGNDRADRCAAYSRIRFERLSARHRVVTSGYRKYNACIGFARLAHHAPVRSGFIVYASRGGIVRVGANGTARIAGKCPASMRRCRHGLLLSKSRRRYLTKMWQP